MLYQNVLSNGIKVVLENMPYLRSVSLGVWVKAGSVNETKNNNGISHMIEHMLFKGTTNRTAKKLAEDMTCIGGNMNAYTSKEYTTYYVTTLDEHLPMAIDIISDMINNSLFCKEDIEKEKEVIIEEIDMYDDSPEDLVHEMLQKSIWNNNPLGYIISGEKDVIKSFTREEIIDFKDKYYSADKIVISIAGNFDNSSVIELLEKRFGNIHTCKNSDTDWEKPKYHKCFCSKIKDMEQVHMNIAYDCIEYCSDERYVFSVVNSISGGNENSRLFQKIREEEGLTYSIYSYGSSFKYAGLFHINAVLNPKKLELVYKKLFDVMNELRKGGILEQELIQTKEQIKTELIIGSESTRSRMNGNGKSLLQEDRIVSLDEMLAGIDNVKCKDVQNFFDKYIHSDKASISLVGNMTDKNISMIKGLWEKTSDRKGE